MPNWWVNLVCGLTGISSILVLFFYLLFMRGEKRWSSMRRAMYYSSASDLCLAILCLVYVIQRRMTGVVFLLVAGIVAGIFGAIVALMYSFFKTCRGTDQSAPERMLFGGHFDGDDGTFAIVLAAILSFVAAGTDVSLQNVAVLAFLRHALSRWTASWSSPGPMQLITEVRRVTNGSNPNLERFAFSAQGVDCGVLFFGIPSITEF